MRYITAGGLDRVDLLWSINYFSSRMQSVIIRPKNEILKKYIQYFLFFKKTDASILKYSTFPNNNLCLAIYRENKIDYIKDADRNNCLITQDTVNFKSRLFGFHKMPFNVEIRTSLDQVCILFHPAALSVFTHESFEDLINSDYVFDIFKNRNEFILEQIFEEENFSIRADKLESLLLANLNDRQPEKLKEALYLIGRGGEHHLSIETLAGKLGISNPTLFRLFKNNVGLNPKSYIRTWRFRNILNEILDKRSTLKTLTSAGHSHLYYDQAHFIKDFRSFSGHSPNQLIDKISVEHNDLAWIFNKK